MPSTNRSRVKNRATSGSFTALPHHLFRATGGKPPPAAVLSPRAHSLLIDIAQQLNGNNNGNLSAAPKVLAPYGRWTSRGTVDAALVELVALGFLEQTRQGGKNRCSLYAVTWLGIDEGPHDAGVNPVPSRLWLAENAPLRDQAWVRRWEDLQSRRKLFPHSGQSFPYIGQVSTESGCMTT